MCSSAEVCVMEDTENSVKIGSCSTIGSWSTKPHIANEDSIFSLNNRFLRSISVGYSTETTKHSFSCFKATTDQQS